MNVKNYLKNLMNFKAKAELSPMREQRILRNIYRIANNGGEANTELLPEEIYIEKHPEIWGEYPEYIELKKYFTEKQEDFDL